MLRLVRLLLISGSKLESLHTHQRIQALSTTLTGCCFPEIAIGKHMGSTWRGSVTPDGGIHRFGSAGRWLGGEPRGRRPLARQPTTGQQRRQAKRELPGTASMMRAAEPSAART